MYIVVVSFADLRDNNRLYRTGDIFPRPGLVVSEQRIKELAGWSNKIGRPLIVEKPEEPEQTEEPEEAEKQQPEEVTEEKPKRGRKKKDTGDVS